jgi:hypothetical protein
MAGITVTIGRRITKSTGQPIGRRIAKSTRQPIRRRIAEIVRHKEPRMMPLAKSRELAVRGTKRIVPSTGRRAYCRDQEFTNRGPSASCVRSISVAVFGSGLVEGAELRKAVHLRKRHVRRALARAIRLNSTDPTTYPGDSKPSCRRRPFFAKIMSAQRERRSPSSYSPGAAATEFMHGSGGRLIRRSGKRGEVSCACKAPRL